MTRVARFIVVQTYQNGKNIPNHHKINQTTIKYTKIPKNIPNGHKKTKHLQFQHPPNFTQIGIFGFIINHLATPVLSGCNLSTPCMRHFASICAHQVSNCFPFASKTLQQVCKKNDE
jgi:hypothetical protein